MIKIFRNLRQRLLTQKRFTNYLAYAVGEIILVVIGILIALQINNWNEDRKSEKKLTRIYDQLVLDMEKDLVQLKDRKKHYDEKKWLFDRVIQDSITYGLLDSGLTRLLSTIYETNLNLSGVNQLKRFPLSDSLSLGIIELYDLMENVLILSSEREINEEVRDVSKTFRDNYAWYSEWMSKRIDSGNSSEELQRYFLTNKEYKHLIVWYYQIIYGGYVPDLEWCIERLETFKFELENRLNGSK